MILVIFSLFIISFSGIALFSSTTYQAVHNTFEAMTYSLPSIWQVTDVIEPFAQPYYDTILVEETSLKHFKDNLSHYVKSFQVGFYYFDSSSLKESHERYVTGVRISLRAEIPFSSDYYRATTYEIREVNYGC
ncbi:MAG: hypothetical protein MJ208_03585 [Bacilli bacterium]|nr:hypothetical protein [Bacilli bacterium]